MQIKKILEKPIAAIAFFCLSLFLLANQTSIIGGLCSSSGDPECNDLNMSSHLGEHIRETKDYFGSTRTNLFIAPTGFLLPNALNHIDDIEMIVGKRGKFTQYIYFDKKDEDFNIKKGESKIISDGDFKIEKGDIRLETNESHLYIGFILIKLMVLLNLIWWIPLGWLLYKVSDKYKKSRKIFLLSLFLLPIGIRLLQWFFYLI